jgi:hypothetical protein
LHEARQRLRDVEFAAGPYEAADGADCVVILTEWDKFRALDLDRLAGVMRRPIVVDLRNVYRPEEMALHDFRACQLRAVELAGARRASYQVSGPGCGQRRLTVRLAAAF